MQTLFEPALFSLSGPARLPDLETRPDGRSLGREVLVILLILWIAIVDVCSPRTNLAVFYIIPLLLLAQTGDLRHLWRIVGLAIALTYVAYAVKKILDPAGPPALFLHYRFMNRTFAAVVVVSAAWLLQVWVRWRREQSDTELPEVVRHHDREYGETLAFICCVPLIVAIGAIDLWAPADYNLAILYPIPLLISVWINSRRLLWVMLAILLVMTTAAQLWGPPVSDPAAVPSLLRNRFIAQVGLVMVTVILHFWVGKQRPDPTNF